MVLRLIVFIKKLENVQINLKILSENKAQCAIIFA